MKTDHSQTKKKYNQEITVPKISPKKLRFLKNQCIMLYFINI